ncbi:MAG: hypothetical protein J6S21_02860 [Victivallales bacterium]|nr:hypothetical protein [Victivallales bacterium]
MSKEFFFDDTRLFRRAGLKRSYTRPEEAAVFNDGEWNTAHPGGWVLRQPDGTFRMIYTAGAPGGKALHFLSAVSADGVHFEKDLNAAAAAGLENPAAPHQLIPDLPDCSEVVCCFEDHEAAADARYKMLIAIFNWEERRMYDYMMISPDTLHWTTLHTVQWHARGSEPVGSCCYDSARKRWMIATRPDWGDRRIAGIYTTDWETFTSPKLLMSPDGLDENLVEFYGLCLADLDGNMIGLLDRYNPGDKDMRKFKFMGGTMTCELVYSRDGECWQRTLRLPFAGDDKKMFFPSAIRQDERNLYIYGSYSEKEHGYFFPEDLCTGIKIFRSPKDRLVALETEGEEAGILALRQCVWNGGKLQVNLKTEKATMALYDHTDGEDVLIASHEECIPFSGDSLAWEPRWKNLDSMDSLKGKLLVFEVKLENGAIWTISGDFKLLHTTEAFRYQKARIVPTRKGF